MKNKSFDRRRLKYGSLATIITIGFIAIIILLNVVASAVMERYPLTIDLTSNKRFALSEQSIEYLENLEQEVKITVLNDEAVFGQQGTAYRQVDEIIGNYKKRSGKIAVEYVNLNKNPSFSQTYADLSLAVNDIIVESSLRYKKVSTNDMFTQTQEGTFDSQAEQILTGAIMAVADKELPQVSFLQVTDSDVSLSGYESLLTSNNYEVKTQNLMTETIDPASVFAVLPQPKGDLTAEQAERLAAYLDNDGKLGKGLVFVASTEKVGPVLKNFLAEWGLEISDKLLGETDPYNMVLLNNQYNPYNLLSSITDGTIAGGISSSGMFLTAYTHAVNTVFETKDTRSTRIIAQTAESAIEVPENLEDLDESENGSELLKKSYPTVALGQKTRYEGTDPQVSYVLAYGSPAVLDQQYLGMSGLNNAKVAVSLANELAGKDNTVQIVPVNISEMTPLNISAGHVRVYRVIFMIALPILIIVLGIVVWYRRRHT